MLNSSKVNSYEFNLQWLLKQVCDNLGVKLLQTYALIIENLLKVHPKQTYKWLDVHIPIYKF